MRKYVLQSRRVDGPSLDWEDVDEFDTRRAALEDASRGGFHPFHEWRVAVRTPPDSEEDESTDTDAA